MMQEALVADVDWRIRDCTGGLLDLTGRNDSLYIDSLSFIDLLSMLIRYLC